MSFEKYFKMLLLRYSNSICVQNMKVGYKYKYISYKFNTFQWPGRIGKCISYNTLHLLMHYFSYVSYNKLERVIKGRTHCRIFKSVIHSKPCSLDFSIDTR